MRRDPGQDTLLVIEGQTLNGCHFDRNEAFPRGIFSAAQDFASDINSDGGVSSNGMSFKARIGFSIAIGFRNRQIGPNMPSFSAKTFQSESTTIAEDEFTCAPLLSAYLPIVFSIYRGIWTTRTDNRPIVRCLFLI